MISRAFLPCLFLVDVFRVSARLSNSTCTLGEIRFRISRDCGSLSPPLLFDDMGYMGTTLLTMY